jgi:hypothetical protein
MYLTSCAGVARVLLSPEYPAIGTARALAEANTVAPIAAVTAQKALTDPLSRIALSPISHKVDFTTVILLLESPLPNDYYSSPPHSFHLHQPQKGSGKPHSREPASIIDLETAMECNHQPARSPVARVRHNRPRRRAADQRDELTPHLHFNDLVSAAASGLD